MKYTPEWRIVGTPYGACLKFAYLGHEISIAADGQVAVYSKDWSSPLYVAKGQNVDGIAQARNFIRKRAK